MPKFMLAQLEISIPDDHADQLARDAISELVVDPRIQLVASRISSDDHRRLLPEPRAQGDPPDHPAAQLVRDVATSAARGGQELLDALHGLLPDGHHVELSTSMTVLGDGRPSTRHARMVADGPDVTLSEEAHGEGPPEAAAAILRDLAAQGFPIPTEMLDPETWTRVEESIPPTPGGNHDPDVRTDPISDDPTVDPTEVREHAASDPDCPFCPPAVDPRIVASNTTAIAIESLHPVTTGHSLVIPRRHASDPFTLSKDELLDVVRLVLLLRDRSREDPSVDGFNVGINCGTSAGQTIPHVHVHVIPRRSGDHPDPRGGIRCVIVGKATYQQDR